MREVRATARSTMTLVIAALLTVVAASVPLRVVVAQSGSTEEWIERASMSTPRSQFAAVTGPDGLIYAIGGWGFSNSALRTVEAYNPATNAWNSRAPMPTARDDLAAVTGPDGLIYALGGYPTFDTVEAYNPTTNTWISRAPLPYLGAGTNVAAATGSDGLIYAIGSSVAAYNPATNTWTARAAVPSGQVFAAVTGADGLVYALGDNFQAYNPATDTWAPRAPMPSGRWSLALTTGPDGLIYAIGGASSTAGSVATVEAYNPTTNTWTEKATLPTARHSLAAITAQDGLIYAIGGSNGSGNPGLSTVEAYRPSKQVQPSATATPVVSPPTNPVVPKTTKVLSSSALGHLIPSQRNHPLDVTAASLTLHFVNAPAKIRSLKPGQFIVAGSTPETPNGMSRKVLWVKTTKTSIAYRAGRNAKQATAPGGFDTNIGTGYGPQTNPQPLDWKGSVPVPGCADQLQQSVALGSNASVDVSFCVTSVNVATHIDANRTNGSLMATAAYQETFTLHGGGDYDKEVPLQSIDFKPFSVVVGSVVLLIKPSFESSLTINANVDATAGYTIDGSVSACVTHDSGGWTHSYGSDCSVYLTNPLTGGRDTIVGSDFSPTVTPSVPTAVGHIGVTFTAGPHVKIYVDGLAGPDIGVEGSLALNLDYATDTGGSWSINAGIHVPIALCANLILGDACTSSKDLINLPNIYTSSHHLDGTGPPPSSTQPSVPTITHISLTPGSTTLSTDIHIDWSASTGSVRGYRVSITETSFYGTVSTFSRDVPSTQTSYDYTVTDIGIVPAPLKDCFTVSSLGNNGFVSAPSNSVCTP